MSVVVVSGSVEWADFQTILHDLAKLPRGTVIRHGGARGADTLAGIAARSLGFEEDVCDADWSVKPDTPRSRIRRRRNGALYDVRAGYDRTEYMLDKEPKPEALLAYQLNGSGGTQHAMDEAARRGILVMPTRRWT